MIRRRLEEQVQRDVIAYLEAVLPRAIVWACPNAARRSAGGYAGNAVPGLKKGAPDLIVALPEGRCLHVECKAEKGRASLEQIDFHGRLHVLGHPVCVVRSVDDMRRALAVLQIETREAI